MHYTIKKRKKKENSKNRKLSYEELLYAREKET